MGCATSGLVAVGSGRTPYQARYKLKRVRASLLNLSNTSTGAAFWAKSAGEAHQMAFSAVRTGQTKFSRSL